MAKNSERTEHLVHTRLSEERTGELLDIAAEVFFEYGFAAASVGEMARRAKASKSTFYSRYPSKDLLFEGIIRRQTDTAFDTFRAVFEDDGKNVEQTLRQFSVQMFDLVLSPNATALLRILYMEARHFPELGKAFYEHGYARIRRALVDYLREQVRKGHLRIDNIPIAAEQFVEGLIGELSRRLALLITSVPSRRDRDLRITNALKTFFAAYGVRPQ